MMRRRLPLPGFTRTCKLKYWAPEIHDQNCHHGAGIWKRRWRDRAIAFDASRLEALGSVADRGDCQACKLSESRGSSSRGTYRSALLPALQVIFARKL